MELAEELVALARSMEHAVNPAAAMLVIDDAASELKRCLARGTMVNAHVQAVQAEMSMIRGTVLFHYENFDQAYQEFLIALGTLAGSTASAPGLEQFEEVYFWLGETSLRRRRQFEAAAWYCKAAEVGSRNGLAMLETLMQVDGRVLTVLPRPIHQLLAKQAASTEKKPYELLSSLWSQYSPAVDLAKKKRNDTPKKAEPTEVQLPSSLAAEFDRLFKDEYDVFLVQGRNTTQEEVYTYLRVPRAKERAFLIASNGGFKAEEYGKILAGGIGKPPQILADEMSRLYPVVSTGSGGVSSPLVIGKQSLVLGPWERLVSADIEPERLLELLSIRAGALFAEKGDVGEAIHCAEELHENGRTNHRLLYNAACAYALAAKAALSKADHKGSAETCQRSAIDCLKESISAGFSDFAFLAKDDDLDALHDLPEFKALFPKAK